MSRRLKSLLSLILLALCLASITYFIFIGNPFSARGPTLIVECSLEGFPKEIPQLKIVNRSITPEQAKTIAEEVVNLLPEKNLEKLDEDLKKYNISTFSRPEKITVQSVELRYFSWDLSTAQEYLLPVYYLTFEIEWKEGQPCPEYPIYYAALSALDGTYVYGLSLTGISPA